MKNKKTIHYMIQTNLEGGYDIVQTTTQGKIVAHTENEEAAKELVRMMNKQ